MRYHNVSHVPILSPLPFYTIPINYSFSNFLNFFYLLVIIVIERKGGHTLAIVWRLKVLPSHAHSSLYYHIIVLSYMLFL